LTNPISLINLIIIYLIIGGLMKTFCIDIQLKVDSEDLTEQEISGEISNCLDKFISWVYSHSAYITTDLIKVEEAKHGFRVLVNGEWCEPSDGFAKTVKSIDEALSRGKS
jgi:hypothetical protein